MRLLAAAAVLISAAAPSSARIHDLDIVNDGRQAFSIETFAFLQGGSFKANVKNFKITGAANARTEGAFLFRKTTTEVAVKADVDIVTGSHGCLQGDYRLEKTDVAVNLTTGGSVSMDAVITEPGLYSLLYSRCSPKASGQSSFKLHAEFVNPGGNYLSAGMEAVPLLLGVSALLFGAATGFWVYHLRAHPTKIHTVHRLMTVLVAARTVTVATEAIQLAAIASVGHPTGWSALYYTVLVFKGLLFGTALLLIGTGWSLLKPFVSATEFRVLMVVVPAQTLASIAIIVLDELPPGSTTFQDWTIVFHIVELVASCAVLLPIAWTMRFLASAAGADGRARDALDRLQRFRNFFFVTMLYLYFTRFGKYIFQETMPYWAQWVPVIGTEIATIAFYVWVGLVFGPAADNPYTRVRADSGDDGEFGLPDDGVDTAAAAAAGPGEAGDDGEVVAAEEGRRPKPAAPAAPAGSTPAPPPARAGGTVASAPAPAPSPPQSESAKPDGATATRDAASLAKARKD